MKKLILFLGLLPFLSEAQFVRGPIYINNGVLDGVYIDEHIPTKKVIPHEYVRAADVTWSKRMWSSIDLRQKINHSLYYPLDKVDYAGWNRYTSIWSLWTIIRHHVLAGDLTLYSPFNPNWESWKDGDSFKYPIYPTTPDGTFYSDESFKESIFLYLGNEIVDPEAIPLTSMLDPTIDSMIQLDDGSWKVIYPPNDTSWFNSQDIISYTLKEDWYFDKEKSMVEKRIIGIAPVVYQKDVNGNITGTRELFWLYFPQCRYIFQNYFVANSKNDAQRMSLDDLFMKRMFHSYAIKESNIYNRQVDEYKAGVDALIEAGRIKSEISRFEHDLWAY
ncbi:type IX secretion system ring subunit PorN/GldN [Crocinitomix algicola]|uniref:type IX secretion system ring protein PorN/GldN n=1 Tax=Crocinitomix algicola TaxID=1740263 RepID=UPI00087222E3|nr:gliding motility protein GldN [Crocinitomix algicola]